MKKESMRTVLFYLFIAIFATTAIAAIVGIILVFSAPDNAGLSNQKINLVWALVSAVIIEVVAFVIMLAKDLFGLSGEKEAVNTGQRVLEMIDSLVTYGKITKSEADQIKDTYKDILPKNTGVSR